MKKLQTKHLKLSVGTGVFTVAALFLVFASVDRGRSVADTPRAAAAIEAGTVAEFQVTAYCTGTRTAAGVRVTTGIAAADPKVLPVGSVIQVDTLDDRYDGIYTIMDTGPKVRGRIIDIYLENCREAKQLGREKAEVTVIRYGWDPQDIADVSVD